MHRLARAWLLLAAGLATLRHSYHDAYRQRGPSMLVLGDRLRWEWVR